MRARPCRPQRQVGTHLLAAKSRGGSPVHGDRAPRGARTVEASRLLESRPHCWELGGEHFEYENALRSFGLRGQAEGLPLRSMPAQT